MTALHQRVLNVITCFRRQWRLFADYERTTVCGADCMLMALQLSMAEVNKQLHGDFTVSLSELLETWKYLLHDKLGLSYENMKEPENYAGVKEAYSAFLARSSVLDLIDVCQKCCDLQLLSEEESVEAVQLLEFISGMRNVQENTRSVVSTAVNSQGQENEKVAVLARKCVCSYLSLLVNSKDDLALAHILNVPDRGLGREAFNKLKHASRERKMSIFLMATSFVRTLELGGRGCASSLCDPLRGHVKGLSDFVHFIDKLQEIVGETSDPRVAGGRILSTVRMHLIKGRSNGDPFCQAVEEVVQDLDLKIKNIIDSRRGAPTASTSGVSPARVMRLLFSLACCSSHVTGDNLSYMRHCFPLIWNIAVVLVQKGICGFRRLANLGMLQVHCHFALYRNPSKEKAPQSKKPSCQYSKLIPDCYLQMKQPSIKSQFACTYKTGLSERKCLSSRCAPACREPAPARRFRAASASEGLNPCLAAPVLGTISENVHQTRSYPGTGRLGSQPRNKGSRSEQMDLNNGKVICGTGSEPALRRNAKRPKASSSSQKDLDSEADGKGRRRRAGSRDKLIAGQAKLTHFF
ncbi:PARI protein, partial [Rhinopomastus cyanomelas]|nr:PARI protein [Rhinopomastus cyanomelas]